MIVVSNSSPIMNLAAVGQLDLLRTLYGRLIIPQAVYEEIAIAGKGRPGANDVEVADWIEARAPANRSVVTALLSELDRGEAEVLALAVEISAALVLLDERLARRVAARFGLRFVGLLGVLIEAKAKGLLLQIRPILDQLISQAGFWIDPQLYADVLRAAGETTAPFIR